jgi:hypothetical protein
MMVAIHNIERTGKSVARVRSSAFLIQEQTTIMLAIYMNGAKSQKYLGMKPPTIRLIKIITALTITQAKKIPLDNVSFG